MSGLLEAVAEETQRIASDALDLCWQATVDAAPERTGALRQLIRADGPTMSGQVTAQGEIRCDADYAEWTDKGSDPHIIQGNPLLAFYWEKVGRDMVLPFVNHPGTRGTQWFNSGEDGGEPMRSRWEDSCLRAL